MATIHHEMLIDARPADVWDALRDWGALHERLAPGFAVDARLDGTDRIVTFFTGSVLRERLISLDDDARRLAWSIVDGPYTHHHGVAQVFAAGDTGTRFVWVTDLLPDEAADRTAAMMRHGLAVIRETLARDRH
jgi:hypothetical protein